MNRHFSFLRQGLVFGTALCALLYPALLLANATAQMPGPEGEPDDSKNPVMADQTIPATADPLHQGENHWRLRFNLSFVNPLGESVSTSMGHGGLSFDMDAGAGASFQAEYRVSARLGIELGVLGAAGFDISNWIFNGNVHSDIGLTGFAPISLGLNIHLTPQKAYDLYAGPQIALVNYETGRAWWDLGWAEYGVSVDNDWAWGLVAGLDVPIGKRGWLFNANLRYLETNIKQSRGDFHFDGEFDPVIFSVGFGYAF